MNSWKAIGAANQNANIKSVNATIGNYVTDSITAQQQAADALLKSQGNWVTTASAAEVARFAKELQPYALGIFQGEDQASYQALIQTMKQLNYPVYTAS
jgi:hypothetical protein